MSLRRVLIAGQFGYGELGQSYRRAFESLGIKTEIFDFQQEYQALPMAENRYFRRLLSGGYIAAMNRRLSKKTLSFAPDLFFITKGHQIHPDVLDRIRSKGIKIFNFYPDNPFYYENRSYGRLNTSKWVYQSFKIYDTFFTFAEYQMDNLRSHGCRRVEYLPFARDPELHQPYEGDDDLGPYRCDVSFVGNLDAERISWLNGLEGHDLKIWGEKKRLPLSEGHWLCGKIQSSALYGRDFSKAVKMSKISLNLMRQVNVKSHNMRTYEIPSCGGFILSLRNEEVTRLFREGIEAAYFSSAGELSEKIRYYLAHPEEREKIAAAAWEKVRADTYRERVKKVMCVYDDLPGAVSIK